MKCQSFWKKTMAFGKNMKVLNYPFDSNYIMKKRKSIKSELLERSDSDAFITKRIAILGGSTTHDIKEILNLFLLNYGIKAEFYESEYNQYWQDVMFENPKLIAFNPELVYIHTTQRNIHIWPSARDTQSNIGALIEKTYNPFEVLWEKIDNTFQCVIIQNNFELPYYRIMGNRDAWDERGKVNFVNHLNDMFYRYARQHQNFYINDINYLSAEYGLKEWLDPFCWHMYKCACALSVIPEFAFSLANIIKSIYGKNKKALVLDLDNTLWGGVIGDDGPENIEIGQETSTGQLFSEFQEYIKAYKDLGILLNINSKNEMENAIAGLNRPDSILKPEDFIIVKANWISKESNLAAIAKELNIGMDSIVFVDDNPAERHIVESQLPDVAVPEMISPEKYIQILDKSGYFEVTSISKDDLSRNEMYFANLKRGRQEALYGSYEEYLLSLEMCAEVKPFSEVYMSRIAQLTNKSNQFNLTTRRCTQVEIEAISKEKNNITLYGRLEDKFGDNGVVAVTFGHQDGNVFHIDLWLMSCRVLKRNMEIAMMDVLINRCMERHITEIVGYYFKSSKNSMVSNFYDEQGFVKFSEDEQGNTVWKFKIPSDYLNRNNVILMET